jgi:hypothetical protein
VSKVGKTCSQNWIFSFLAESGGTYL